MEQMLQTYALSKETVTFIMIQNMKAMVCSPDGNTEFFDYDTGVFPRDTNLPKLYTLIAQSAGAVEYTNCFSAEG